jgi:hypothetical protein
VSTAALLLACESKGTRSRDQELSAEQRELSAQALADKEAEVERRRKAEEAAKEAQDAERRQKELALAAAERHQACCQSLARRGFEERSEADMAAKKLCLEAIEQERSLSDVESAIRAALGDRLLPTSCAGPAGR